MANLTNEKAEFAIAIFRHFSAFFAIGPPPPNVILSISLRGRSHNMTSSPKGEGGFQMMTIDDEGGGRVWPIMTSSQKSKIFGKFLRFYMKFFQNFSQFFRIQDKNFHLQT